MNVGAQFIIKVRFNGNFYIYQVKLIERTKREEVYHVITRSRMLVFRSNRPFFRNRGIHHRRPDWKIDETLLYPSFIKDIIAEIERNVGY